MSLWAMLRFFLLSRKKCEGIASAKFSVKIMGFLSVCKNPQKFYFDNNWTTTHLPDQFPDYKNMMQKVLDCL